MKISSNVASVKIQQYTIYSLPIIGCHFICASA